MGYSRGAPSWVYKNQMARQSASYQHQISVLDQTIKELKKENEVLKEKIKALEIELTRYKS